jgi:3',5'-cyclic AMP phosphodiesterase CpdA
MFTLAHLSDPHLAPLPRPRPTELLNKRGLGYLNWLRGRRNVHRPEVLQQIVGDLKAHKPDHIIVSGDLVNLSLAAEFSRARSWLEALGRPDDVTVVPGNHDSYVKNARHRSAENWGDYMRGDDGANSITFPFVRRRGPVALIALSSSVPTALLMATGALGEDQIARLAPMLEQTRGAFRVVVIHHPPFSPPQRHFKRLTDSAELRAVLAAKGAELLIHGHDHRRSLIWLDGPDGKKIPAVGVSSASAVARHGKDDAAAYNLFQISGETAAWRCEMTSRQRDAAGVIQTVEQRPL